jgi:DNA (cytosine-5)-methyltransferase 1
MRSTLICKQLSFVEFYNPDFFLLENVVGLLNFRLRAQQEGDAFVGGIQSGVVKFIC